MKNIFLHGALASHQQFNFYKSLFDGEWLAPDLIGHGSYPLAELQTMTIPALLSQVKSIIDQEGCVNIFGYSLGGYIALLLAHQFPHQVNKVITLGTIIHWDENIYTREATFLNPSFLLEKVPAFVSSLQQIHETPWQILLQHTNILLQDITTHQYLAPEILQEIKSDIYIGRRKR